MNRNINPRQGMSTLATHALEGDNPHHAHVSPIFQTSTFGFEDSASGAEVFNHTRPGYIYTRLSNPNLEQTAGKIAILEGLDLLRAQPATPWQEIVAGRLFASGMAAVTAAIMARVPPGGMVIAQSMLYSATYNFLQAIAPRCGIGVVFLTDTSPAAWEDAFASHPAASLAYAESPANPTMSIVDLQSLAAIAHRHNAWLAVDNTFATPYCQRPLTLGADIVIHSTTKYLSGHGSVIGGTVVSRHVEFVEEPLQKSLELLGGSASPFDAWLTNMGLKTFELRMQRHCQNALAVAQALQSHPAVVKVYYPGLPGDPGHELATRQMHAFGGMIAFELKGGVAAGAALMDKVRLCTLAVSLGNVDSLISHPASMTHSSIAPEERRKAGLSDGLVRLSVGVENVEDILADLQQGLE